MNDCLSVGQPVVTNFRCENGPDSVRRPLRVTFLTVMPSPYVQDVFAALEADPRIDLTVWYLEQEAPDTLWGAQRMPSYATVLPGRWFGIAKARVHWNPGIHRAIEKNSADIFVIVGYIGLTNQVAMRHLNQSGRPWVFWGEIPGLHHRSFFGRLIRTWLQRPLRKAAGVAGVGSHAVAAYRSLLEIANPNCVFRNIPYHCKLEEFAQAANRRFSQLSVVAAPLRFLYCGQLILRKGVDLLCRAFDRLVTLHPETRLTLAGEGPLREVLQSNLSDAARKRICFAGFQTVDRLPTFFELADVFILPSRHDGWGVVVNQALAAGLAVVATSAVGATHDLVHQNANGLIIEPGSEESLFDAMRLLCENRDQVRAMGQRSLEMMHRITLNKAVEDWLEFLTTATNHASGADLLPHVDVE